MRFYSHRDPDKLLVDHLRGVYETGIKTFASKRDLKLPVIEKDIRTALSYALILHDIGKATNYFQDYLWKKNDYNRLKNEGLSNHGLISALITALQVEKSVDNELDRKILSSIAFAIVKRHHGNLNNFEDLVTIPKNRWKTIEKQYKCLSFDLVKDEFNEFQFLMIDNSFLDLLNYGYKEILVTHFNNNFSLASNSSQSLTFLSCFLDDPHKTFKKGRKFWIKSI